MSRIIKLLLTTVIIFGISGCVPQPWKDAGFNGKEYESRSWKAWKKAGFTAKEAGRWKKAEFYSQEAIEWKKAGFSEIEAKKWKVRYDYEYITPSVASKFRNLRHILKVVSNSNT